MIDIHPPHHAATTRRDFIVHLSTVVLGILIAIGLEQTVEYIHHRHQLREARATIREELVHDRVAIEYNIAVLRTAEQAMQHNASLLRSSAGSDSKPVSVLEYAWQLHFLRDDAWQDAKASGITAFMSPAERAQLGFIYSGAVERERLYAPSYLTDTNIAKSIVHRADTIKGLTSVDRDQLLKITADTEGQIVSLRMLLEVGDHVLKSYFDTQPNL
jgi:hypothetical protein